MTRGESTRASPDLALTPAPVGWREIVPAVRCHHLSIIPVLPSAILAGFLFSLFRFF